MPLASIVTRDTFGALLSSIGGVILSSTNVMAQLDLGGPAHTPRVLGAFVLLGITLGLFAYIVEGAHTLNRQRRAEADEPSKAAPTRGDVLMQSLSVYSSSSIAVGVLSLATARLTEASLEAGRLDVGFGETILVAGFALCAVGAVLQVKVRKTLIGRVDKNTQTA